MKKDRFNALGITVLSTGIFACIAISLEAIFDGPLTLSTVVEWIIIAIVVSIVLHFMNRRGKSS